MDAVRAIVKAVAPKPVNLVVGTMRGTLPWGELQKAGVKRVSLGVALYTLVMATCGRPGNWPTAISRRRLRASRSAKSRK